MLKIMLSIGLIILLSSSCAVKPSKVKNHKKFAKNITYIYDEKTGLCFAVVATKKRFNVNQSGIGMACVPCERVRKHLKK